MNGYITTTAIFGQSSPVAIFQPTHRVIWDDENPDYGYRCRQNPNWKPGYNPPAVYRFYPLKKDGSYPKEGDGDFRVDVTNWKDPNIRLNGMDVQKYLYWIATGRALFNTQGWPMLMHLVMSGNFVKVIGEANGMYIFQTLKVGDYGDVYGWTIKTHPGAIQNFTCVTWDAQDKVTRRIEYTGTKRGNVYWHLVTEKGVGLIPKRHLKEL